MSLTIDEKIFEAPEDTIKEIDEPLTDARREALIAFAEKIGVKFSHIELLNRALTHKSYSKEYDLKFQYNERLEFLGDSVLGLAVATYLFTKFNHLREGELTRTRSSIVRQSTLTRLARDMGLEELLLVGASEFSGSRGMDTNLEDALEAVIGAIYLEHGWEVARDFVFREFAAEFVHAKVTGVPKDYKSKLQEVAQRPPLQKLTYVDLGSSGPDHMKTFESAAMIDGKIFGRGVGRSKKAAEQEAARIALQKLGELD